MSLKQRAVQCSAHIPDSQYVPVYSRRHNQTNSARWHEELSPITPKPNIDDSYESRTQSIHEAVKLWLESSPNSVLGPLYHSRSPSSGSQHSNGSLGEQQEPAAMAGASADAPVPFLERGDSTPLDKGNDSLPAQDVGGAAALSPTQKDEEAQSSEPVPLENGEESRANVVTPQSAGRKPSSNQVFSREEELMARAEEGTKNSGLRDRGQRGLIRDLKWPDQKHLYGSVASEGSLSDFNSRTFSREIDSVLAAAVVASEEGNQNEASSTTSVYPPAGPQARLKPPRGLEKPVLHEKDENSAADQGNGGNPEEPNRFVGGAEEINSAGNVGDVRSKSEKRRCSTGHYKRSGSIPVAVKNGVLRSRSVSSADNAHMKMGELRADVPNSRVASDAGGGHEIKTEAPKKRNLVQKSYSGRSADSAANLVPPHQLYEVSQASLYEGKSRSMRQSAVTSEESHAQQLKNVRAEERQASPSSVAVEKARRDKQIERVAAWEAAKNATFLNRYKLDEIKIHTWEEHKVAKATRTLTKLEMDLEKKRAKATEKMQMEVAKARKKAEAMKAYAEAKRAERAAKAAVQAQVLRVVGKSPLSCFCT